MPLLWAAAGLVAGIFYQAGGLRRPGMRVNVPLFLLVFLPWTVVTVALVASSTGEISWLADEAAASRPGRARPLDGIARRLRLRERPTAPSPVLEPRTGVVVEEVVADDTDAPRRTVVATTRPRSSASRSTRRSGTPAAPGARRGRQPTPLEAGRRRRSAKPA